MSWIFIGGVVLIFVAITPCLAQVEDGPQFLWNRWEQRTIDCIYSGRPDECVLRAPNAKNPIDLTNYKCRREPMPQSDWNTLAVNSTTRLACPLKCPINFDLSVLQKEPYVNKNCQKYYTYGKYWDNQTNDWFIWMTEPCVAAITTHCRFNDVPARVGKNEVDLTKNDGPKQTKLSEERKKAV
ncbi:unnamed protein product [Caenorhabditis bovis]|uniref:DUF7808 domain-containing protein n=1 Tax=Caenorhabditis bovis TaxID=2654633 RepID=A0A8S1EAX5_9PELO|nr:unnamed protein product [Caenorhabditis bovis]